MKFQYNDGGRQQAGYKGKTGDCVVRAIAIAADLPYQTVYDLVGEHSQHEPHHEATSYKVQCANGRS
jgi:hypothetical protein